MPEEINVPFKRFDKNGIKFCIDDLQTVKSLSSKNIKTDNFIMV